MRNSPVSAFAPDCMFGRAVLVTGASSGIGRQVAVRLAGCGARIVLLGRDHERLDAAKAKLPGDGHVAVAASLDGADEAADLLKKLAAAHGPFGGLFHAAGAELVRPIRMTKQEHVDRLFGAAVMAGLGLARACAMKDVVSDGASLVFVSSVAGQRGTAGMTGYSAAKAAVDGMVRSLACELAPRRIRVNGLVAGAVETEMHERLSRTLGEQSLADYQRQHLLGFGDPDAIAAAALFLLSDASVWITGTGLVVDGGYLAQ